MDAASGRRGSLWRVVSTCRSEGESASLSDIRSGGDGIEASALEHVPACKDRSDRVTFWDLYATVPELPRCHQASLRGMVFAPRAGGRSACRSVAIRIGLGG
jgi:hypothetical protein